MVRPKKLRKVGFEPNATYFKPAGIPLRELMEVTISVDELETLRLSNIEGLSQTDAAMKMNIHQSTFQRILSKAEQKISDALINGKAIRIEGGSYALNHPKASFYGRGKGRGRFRENGF